MTDDTPAMTAARGSANDPAFGLDRKSERRPLWVRILLGGLLGVCVVVLTGLGVWQLQRREWKLALIEHVDQRVHAAPVAPPKPIPWPELTQTYDEYLRVSVSGHFLNDRETLVQAVTELGGGYWVLTPLVTDQGFTVLVNRGFVPMDKRDPHTRAAGEVTGDISITGLLRTTEPKGGFLRANDPGSDRWYSRDVAAIAAARGLTDAAPYFIDADAVPNPGGLPVGGLTVIAFSNNHFVYALTWFTLALGLVGGAIFVFAREQSIARSATH